MGTAASVCVCVCVCVYEGRHGDETLPEMTHRLYGLTPAPHSQPIMSHANEQDSHPACSSLSSLVIHVQHETIV